MPDCVVVVPGIMGSELRLGAEVVWPGSGFDTFVTRYDRLDELLREDLVATRLIERVWVFGVYAELLADLRVLGFREGGAAPTLVPFPYDWRRDVRASAAALADRLDALHDAHAGAAAISLVAHSMGGLVARACLEDAALAARPGVRAVRRAIFLGTPHAGAAEALPGVLGFLRKAFLAGDQVRTLASDTRYPAAYQLLPHRGQPWVWRHGRGLEPADLYEPGVVAALGLVADNLAAALALQRALDPARRPDGVRYFSFVGTRHKTASVVRLRQTPGGGLEAAADETADAGDGTVPVWSALLAGVQAQLVGGEHGRLFRDEGVRRTLPALLGRPGVLVATAAAVPMSVRPTVVSPGDELEVTLAFGGVRAASGTLRVERARVVADAPVAWETVSEEPLRYEGAAAATLALAIPAPAERGAYRIVFAPAGGGPASRDELFVQE